MSRSSPTGRGRGASRRTKPSYWPGMEREREGRVEDSGAHEKRSESQQGQTAQSGWPDRKHQDAPTHDVIVASRCWDPRRHCASVRRPGWKALTPLTLQSVFDSAGVRDCGCHPTSPASCCVPPDPVPARRHYMHAVGSGCSLPPRSQLGERTW